LGIEKLIADYREKSCRKVVQLNYNPYICTYDKTTITSEVLKEEIENEIKELEKASDTDDDGMQIGYKDMGFRVPEEIVDPKIRLIG
jgi:hypothetical protein